MSAEQGDKWELMFVSQQAKNLFNTHLKNKFIEEYLSVYKLLLDAEKITVKNINTVGLFNSCGVTLHWKHDEENEVSEVELTTKNNISIHDPNSLFFRWPVTGSRFEINAGAKWNLSFEPGSKFAATFAEKRPSVYNRATSYSSL